MADEEHEKSGLAGLCMTGVIIFLVLDVVAVANYFRGHEALAAGLPAPLSPSSSPLSGAGQKPEVELLRPVALRASAAQKASPAAAPSAPSSFASARDFLAAWWGERWPEVLERSAVGEGFLDRFPLSELKDWQAARSAVIANSVDYVQRMSATRSHMLCRDERGYVDLESGLLQLTVGDRKVSDASAIPDTMRQHKESLSACGTRYWSAVSAAVHKAWAHGSIEHQPILPAFSAPPTDALYQYSGALHGWCYQVVLMAEEYPELAKAQAALQAAQRACLDDLIVALR